MADRVDVLLDQWRRERPDLDPSPMGILGRIARISRYADREFVANFRQLGIDDWEFDVLATLRRAGAPYRMNPSELRDSLMITSGAVTNRVARLAGRGYIYRQADASDGRGVIVGLTATGLELVDVAVVAHLVHEGELLEDFDAGELESFEAMLRKLLSTLERRLRH